jgi:hypothetical protein
LKENVFLEVIAIVEDRYSGEDNSRVDPCRSVIHGKREKLP